MTSEYATLAEFYNRYEPGETVGADTIRDATITNTIKSVSRSIDSLGPRRFWVNAADALETRYYTAKHTDHIWLPDDLVALTTLATDNDLDGTYECVWSASDFRLSPANAPLDGWPYNQIKRTPMGLYWFPEGANDSVKIVGRFGFPAVPDLIIEACYLQTYRIYLRKSAPFGIAGSADMGQVVVLPKLDPDIELQVMPFLRHT